VAIEEIADQLYGLPPGEFTRTRDEAAGELRKAGQREEAERVKALRKPTAAAAAVNRLVRERRSEVERFLQAATALRDAQFSGKGDLAAAITRERDELQRLVGLGGEVVRQTLLAAAADDDAARRLLKGRLERELEPVGFGTLLAYVRPAAEKPADDTEAQTEAAISAAETDERSARRRWETAQGELDKARAEIGRAEARLDRARGELERARSGLDQARAELDRARAGVEKTRAEAERAGAAVAKAQRDRDLLDAR